MGRDATLSPEPSDACQWGPQDWTLWTGHHSPGHVTPALLHPPSIPAVVSESSPDTRSRRVWAGPLEKGVEMRPRPSLWRRERGDLVEMTKSRPGPAAEGAECPQLRVHPGSPVCMWTHGSWVTDVPSC